MKRTGTVFPSQPSLLQVRPRLSQDSCIARRSIDHEAHHNDSCSDCN
ncbi:hypothetical protein ACKI2N_012730 [Cupriavidus sp. 30B13]